MWRFYAASKAQKPPSLLIARDLLSKIQLNKRYILGRPDLPCHPMTVSEYDYGSKCVLEEI